MHLAGEMQRDAIVEIDRAAAIARDDLSRPVAGSKHPDRAAGGYVAGPRIRGIQHCRAPQAAFPHSVRLGVDNLPDETHVACGTRPDFPARGIDAVAFPGLSIRAGYLFPKRLWPG
jgi:hypothetical protein